MIHHVRGMALGQYRREIDPACPSDAEAEAAILEAVRYGVQVDETRRDGKRRVRAPKRSGAAWSRMYVLFEPATGDIIGVMPSNPRHRPPPVVEVVRQEPRADTTSVHWSIEAETVRWLHSESRRLGRSTSQLASEILTRARVAASPVTLDGALAWLEDARFDDTSGEEATIGEAIAVLRRWRDARS